MALFHTGQKSSTHLVERMSNRDLSETARSDESQNGGLYSPSSHMFLGNGRLHQLRPMHMTFLDEEISMEEAKNSDNERQNLSETDLFALIGSPSIDQEMTTMKIKG